MMGGKKKKKHFSLNPGYPLGDPTRPCAQAPPTHHLSGVHTQMAALPAHLAARPRPACHPTRQGACGMRPAPGRPPGVLPSRLGAARTTDRAVQHHAFKPHPFLGGGDEEEGEGEASGPDDASPSSSADSDDAVAEASSSSSTAASPAEAAAARRALSGAAGWDGRPIGAEYGEVREIEKRQSLGGALPTSRPTPICPCPLHTSPPLFLLPHQGFTHFRPSGVQSHLDVDTLNERLQPSGAARHRLTLSPDEAHGAIFVLEGVVADTGAAAARAWAAVARAGGFPPPPPPSALPSLLAVPPERAITDLLGWTRDWGTARRLGAEVAAAYLAEAAALSTPRAGLGRWWAALAAARVPVAVVSELDRGTVEGMLGRMGLLGGGGGGAGPPLPAPAIVGAEDGADTRAQALLAAALKLGRPPCSCVTFAGCRATIAAAHNASMAAVGVASPAHPAFTLAAADLQVASFDGLTVQNVRRLFAGRGALFMDLAKERVAKNDGGGGGRGGNGGRWVDRPRGAAVDEREPPPRGGRGRPL